jgi:hypothetical protein
MSIIKTSLWKKTELLYFNKFLVLLLRSCIKQPFMTYISHIFKKVMLSRTRHVGSKAARRYSFYSFLTSALDGGELSASRHGRALRPGKDPGIHWVCSLVGLRASLDTQTIEKSFASAASRTPVVHSVVRHYTELPQLHICVYIYSTCLFSLYILTLPKSISI